VVVTDLQILYVLAVHHAHPGNTGQMVALGAQTEFVQTVLHVPPANRKQVAVATITIRFVQIV